MVKKFDLSNHVDIQIVLPQEEADIARFLKDHPPAKTLPTLITPDGVAVSDSLVIAEELSSRFPDAKMWPVDAKSRALARTVAAEMHSSFGGLPGLCCTNRVEGVLPLTPDGFSLQPLFGVCQVQ